MTLNMSMQQDYRLAARRGQLEPFFQPIVDLKDGRFKALEARARWHIGTETLSAREVLARATTDAERVELDFLILEAALAAFSSAPKGLLDGLQLAINLSPATVLETGFSERLENILSNAGFAADRLHLEIPLEAFEHERERASEVVAGLAAAGFTMAVDHLNDPDTVGLIVAGCPVSVIKLDEALVRDLPEDHQACETLAGIVGICRERGVLVGAEGVSRMGQLHCLQGVGCDEAQGMLICRPSPISGLRVLLERGRCW